MLNETTKRTNPLFVLLMGIVFVLLLLWLIPAGLSGDLRWFLPGVSEHPHELIIWDHGETVALHPGDAEYGPIAAALEGALTGVYGATDYGPSGTTINDYRHSFALEVFYDTPVQIHSRYNLGHPTQILFPLT